jgi:hypothetical protein
LSASIDGQGKAPVDQPHEPLGDAALGPVQAGEEYAGRLANAIGDDRALGQFEIEGGSNELFGNLHKFFGEWHELVDRQAAMALVHRFVQRTRPHTRHHLDAAAAPCQHERSEASWGTLRRRQPAICGDP